MACVIEVSGCLLNPFVPAVVFSHVIGILKNLAILTACWVSMNKESFASVLARVIIEKLSPLYAI